MLSVYGRVRAAGREAAAARAEIPEGSVVPMLETHLPVWCTATLGLAEAPHQSQLKQFFSINEATLAILSLENDVSRSLLAKCGGVHMEGNYTSNLLLLVMYG